MEQQSEPQRVIQGVKRDLLTPGEVARILRVDPKTVTRWASQKKIQSVRTPGGHRRFYAAEIMAIATGGKPWVVPGSSTSTAAPEAPGSDTRRPGSTS